MKALVYERSIPRFAAANLIARISGNVGAAAGPVQLKELDLPTLPNDNWHRVTPLLSGICGSDLSAVSGRTSGYFEQVVSFPFVLGHEIVGLLDDGARVVIKPALGCAARGIAQFCPSCANGLSGTCQNQALGDIAAGIQTGYCSSTGGGWSDKLIAHTSQIHVIPDSISNEAAVLIEPTACAVHAVRQDGFRQDGFREQTSLDESEVAIIGAGTLGLLVTAALRNQAHTARITIAAKYPHQRRLAAELGANHVVSPDELLRAIRRNTSSLQSAQTLLCGPRLSGGASVVFDCIGNSQSLTQALSVVRPGGRIVLVGMPARVSIDLAPLWQREVELVGAYCYSSDSPGDFALATDLVEAADLGRLVTDHYPLAQFHHALDHAAKAGGRGSVKVVFDLTTDLPKIGVF